MKKWYLALFKTRVATSNRNWSGRKDWKWQMISLTCSTLSLWLSLEHLQHSFVEVFLPDLLTDPIRICLSHQNILSFVLASSKNYDDDFLKVRFITLLKISRTFFLENPTSLLYPEKNLNPRQNSRSQQLGPILSVRSDTIFYMQILPLETMKLYPSWYNKHGLRLFTFCFLSEFLAFYVAIKLHIIYFPYRLNLISMHW